MGGVTCRLTRFFRSISSLLPAIRYPPLLLRGLTCRLPCLSRFVLSHRRSLPSLSSAIPSLSPPISSPLERLRFSKYYNISSVVRLAPQITQRAKGCHTHSIMTFRFLRTYVPRGCQRSVGVRENVSVLPSPAVFFLCLRWASTSF